MVDILSFGRLGKIDFSFLAITDRSNGFRHTGMSLPWLSSLTVARGGMKRFWERNP